MSNAAQNFVMVGERTNVTGSAKFRKLIEANDYAAALEVARQQVENGANMLDVNMDEGMLNSEAAMVTFLNLLAAEPDISRVPIMIELIEMVGDRGRAEMRARQVGRELDQPEGRRGALSRARQEGPPLRRGRGGDGLRRAGPGRDRERKFEICKRAYELLTEKVGFPPEDIIFDPNIFAVATGIEEHSNYGLAYIEATRRIKAELPYVHVSGGVSNLSFAFRGNERVREAMHSVFLYHAIQAGMDMGIVNAGQLALYDDIDPELRELVEDVILNRRADATDRLLEAAEKYRGEGAQKREVDLAWREKPVRGAPGPCAGAWRRHLYRRGHRGSAARGRAPAARHRRPADDRHERRRRSVRLRQDVPAAGGEVGARDEAGGRLSHALHGEGEGGAWARPRRAAGRIVMATVKGDVHDIGKNIVGVVLQCNNYEVIDLGVMVSAQKILDTARERNADIIGLSGLITPSLDEMCHVAAEMEREGFDLPLLIGGATTSRVHTAVKISPNYHRSQAIYVTDASRAVGVVSSLMSPEERPKAIARVREEYTRMAESHAAWAGGEIPHVDRRRASQPPQARLEDLPAAEAELPRHAQPSATTTSQSLPATSTGRRSSRPGS